MITLALEDDAILKQIAPIYDFEKPLTFMNHDETLVLGDFVDSMLVAMKINNGIGLAAPQMGHNQRIFVMKVHDEEYICINPEIKERSEAMNADQEGCLSFPLLTLTVKRHDEIFVSYQNIEGVVVQRWLNGTVARCFQHELDHLDGITFDTRVASLSLRMARQKRRKKQKQQQRKK